MLHCTGHAALKAHIALSIANSQRITCLRASGLARTFDLVSQSVSVPSESTCSLAHLDDLQSTFGPLQED